jgi:hypothetical protein
MNTLILNVESANYTIQSLLEQADTGVVEVRDSKWQVIAYVFVPQDREAWMYAQTHVELDRRHDAIRQALARRGGVSTRELLENAEFQSRTSHLHDAT